MASVGVVTIHYIWNYVELTLDVFSQKGFFNRRSLNLVKRIMFPLKIWLQLAWLLFIIYVIM